MRAYMSQFRIDTDHSHSLLSRVGISVQCPPLWAVPVAPHLHEGRGVYHCPANRSGNSSSTILTTASFQHTFEICCVNTGPGAQTPQPSGASGKLGKKRKLNPVQSISFHNMELDTVNMSARLKNKQTHFLGHYMQRHVLGSWTGPRLQCHIN